MLPKQVILKSTFGDCLYIHYDTLKRTSKVFRRIAAVQEITYKWKVSLSVSFPKVGEVTGCVLLDSLLDYYIDLLEMSCHVSQSIRNEEQWLFS